MKTNLTSVDFEQTPVNQSKLIDNFEKMKKMSGIEDQFLAMNGFLGRVAMN